MELKLVRQKEREREREIWRAAIWTDERTLIAHASYTYDPFLGPPTVSHWGVADFRCDCTRRSWSLITAVAAVVVVAAAAAAITAATAPLLTPVDFTDKQVPASRHDRVGAHLADVGHEVRLDGQTTVVSIGGRRHGDVMPMGSGDDGGWLVDQGGRSVAGAVGIGRVYRRADIDHLGADMVATKSTRLQNIIEVRESECNKIRWNYPKCVATKCSDLFDLFMKITERKTQ